MPYADPQKQAEYLRKYHDKNKGARNLARRESYRQTKKTDTKVANKPRKTVRSKTRITVTARRKWVIYEGRLYTNSELGWTVADLLEMANELMKVNAKAEQKVSAKGR